MVAAASLALGLTTVSCGTEPEELSPLTGDWISASGFLLPSLTLDLLEEDGGEISGTVVMTLGAWELQGAVEGTYAHPAVQLSVTDDAFVLARYTGTRSDDNTIDGEFVFVAANQSGAMRLTRLSPAGTAGDSQASGVRTSRGRTPHAADREE